MSREAIFEASLDYFLGPIREFLHDETVTEVMVNGHDEVYIERRGQLIRTDAAFAGPDALLSAVHNVAQYVGREIDEDRPVLDARLPDGSRVHAVIPPSARSGTYLTIRKFQRDIMGLGDFVRLGSLSDTAREFLELCVVLRKNIVVAGGTGTGKTTMLNAVSTAIPEEERIVVIEDSSELRLAQTHCLYLESQQADRQGQGGLEIRDLFRASLRMRPDRILVGEVRGGEALDMALQKQTFAARDDVQLHNLYGPTEAAIDVSYWACRDEDGHTVPIGAPISNIQLHALDTDLNPVPRGVPGELYLAGVGLARGYYGRADLTADRFIPNPFGEPGARMYRTGDQVVQRADGIIEYLGRLDHQVKIRGLRIELGEIEQQLKQQPDVDDAVVVAHHSEAGDQLVAYVVSKSDNRDGWQQTLAAALPDYMVPALFMVLEQMPLSPNGKLDRKALPAPQWQAREYRAPQTDTEQQLASLWEELLGQPRVGLDDNFFALGGHSLLATRVVAALRDRWGVDIPLRALFEADSLQALAALVDQHNVEARQQEDDDLAAMADLLDDLEDL